VPRKPTEPHLHADLDVTNDRLNAFAAAPRAHQVAVLARLRAQSADVTASTVLTLTSLLLATLLVLAAPLLTVDVDPKVKQNPLLITVLIVVLTLMLLVAFVPAFIGSARDANRKERAAVWLGAYQDELARRHRLRGREAREWKRTH
jgi:hypothetical protein